MQREGDLLGAGFESTNSGGGVKTCVFCDKKRPHDYREKKWEGVRYSKEPSYWACPECQEIHNLGRYVEYLEGRRESEIRCSN